MDWKCGKCLNINQLNVAECGSCGECKALGVTSATTADLFLFRSICSSIEKKCKDLISNRKEGASNELKSGLENLETTLTGTIKDIIAEFEDSLNQKNA